MRIDLGEFKGRALLVLGHRPRFYIGERLVHFHELAMGKAYQTPRFLAVEHEIAI